MLGTVKQSVKGILEKYRNPGISINWVRRTADSWLSRQLADDFIKPEKSTYSKLIEQLAQQTNERGAQPLWQGYAGNNIGGATRLPNEVRTSASMGDLYTRLVRERRPNILVEFGTAFGVSGMYFLAGMESAGAGKLLTFDPNEVWAGLAKNNLSQISTRFELVIGTFEENIDKVLAPGQSIDMAFIDAIHTREFVLPQLEIVMAKSSGKGIIILDDINFSDNMRQCWEEVSTDARFCASAKLGDRVGIVELR